MTNSSSCGGRLQLFSTLTCRRAPRITTPPRPVLEPLADFDADGKMVAILAEEIPSLDNGSVSQDGMSVTWKLKKDVTWSDGEPFTADDVKFTFEYVSNEATAATTAGNYVVIDSVDPSIRTRSRSTSRSRPRAGTVSSAATMAASCHSTS